MYYLNKNDQILKILQLTILKMDLWLNWCHLFYDCFSYLPTFNIALSAWSPGDVCSGRGEGETIVRDYDTSPLGPCWGKREVYRPAWEGARLWRGWPGRGSHGQGCPWFTIQGIVDVVEILFRKYCSFKKSLLNQ